MTFYYIAYGSTLFVEVNLGDSVNVDLVGHRPRYSM